MSTVGAAQADSINPFDELNDVRMSQEALPLLVQVKAFIAQTVEPMYEQWQRPGENHTDRWTFAPGQLEVMQEAKDKGERGGWWNCCSRAARTGEGLAKLDDADIAVELGKNPLAAEVMNCSAPDTGNMEVLERVGTPEQKAQWLEPLLAGEIRSAFAMSEPDVASSDAKNIQTSAVRDGDDWVINGEKYYISGAGDPRCKILIVMVKTNATGSRNTQHSQILVPMDTPGVEVIGPMRVFGDDHAPYGHMHLRFTDVRVPEANILLGEDRGFEISQLRLGPGRIHHCMRSIGKAELALDLMVQRGNSRDAFGQPLSKLGGNLEKISRARIDIEAMRMIVLKAAKAMDVLGNKEARIWVSMAKAMVPEKVCDIIDQAMQIHGATGISQWTPLAGLYTDVRHLRFADGPDEVHHMVVGRHELGQH